jgi:hypothetical protein
MLLLAALIETRLTSVLIFNLNSILLGLGDFEDTGIMMILIAALGKQHFLATSG